MRLCSIEGCSGKHVAKSFCAKHYTRYKKHGDPFAYLRKINKCKISACIKKRARQGFCSHHYYCFVTYGEPTPKVKLKFHSASLDEAYENWVIKDGINGCWSWSGWKNNGGYGYFSCKSKREAAHRYSYKKYIGPIKGGLFVLHKCDNPECSNPEHLFLGTNTDNINDAYSKGRRKSVPIESMRRGENCYLSKLKEKDVVEIKKMINNGIGNTQIANIFGVKHSTISCIRCNQTWKHVQI